MGLLYQLCRQETCFNAWSLFQCEFERRKSDGTTTLGLLNPAENNTAGNTCDAKVSKSSLLIWFIADTFSRYVEGWERFEVRTLSEPVTRMPYSYLRLRRLGS